MDTSSWRGAELSIVTISALHFTMATISHALSRDIRFFLECKTTQDWRREINI